MAKYDDFRSHIRSGDVLDLVRFKATPSGLVAHMLREGSRLTEIAE